MFFLLEVIINVSVAFEILMRAVVQHKVFHFSIAFRFAHLKLYFSHYENIVDCLVLFGSLIFMLLFIFISSDVYYEEVAEGTLAMMLSWRCLICLGVDIFLLVIRYLMSFLRSVIMIKKYGRHCE